VELKCKDSTGRGAVGIEVGFTCTGKEAGEFDGGGFAVGVGADGASPSRGEVFQVVAF